MSAPSLKSSGTPHAPSRPLVALVGLAMSGLDAEILRGVQAYAHTHNWKLFNANAPWGLEQIKLNAEIVDGIIAVAADDDRARLLRGLNRPLVNVSNTFPEAYGFPTVISQDARVGNLAVEHFLERGYLNFAVFLLPGQHPYRYINDRARGFVNALHEKGHRCHGIADVYTEEECTRFEAEGWTLKTLRDLPKPCGIFCTDDEQASYICFLTLARGLKIPSEVAVLGVDNFELYCNMSNPPLSSVDLDGMRIGHTAAETLHRLMPLGKPAPYERIEVPPKGIVSRASVDTSAIQDPLLARARQFILEHSHERMNVSDVVRAVGTNRRKLEILYQQHYGHTLLYALNQARIDRARRLLLDTDRPLYQIATLCGFRDTHQMNRVFARNNGPGPREIRTAVSVARKTKQARFRRTETGLS